MQRPLTSHCTGRTFYGHPPEVEGLDQTKFNFSIEHMLISIDNMDLLIQNYLISTLVFTMFGIFMEK